MKLDINPAIGRVNMQLLGRFELSLFRKDELIYFCDVGNLVTTIGENLVSSRMFYSGAPPAAPQYIAFGTGPTAAAKGDLALGAEFAVPRVGATLAGSNANLNKLHLEFTVVPVAPMASAAEIGVFNAAAAGILVSRAVVAPFSMTAADSLFVVWELTFLGVEA